jgi:hypothetical protein
MSQSIYTQTHTLSIRIGDTPQTWLWKISKYFLAQWAWRGKWRVMFLANLLIEQLNETKQQNLDDSIYCKRKTRGMKLE